MSLIYTDRAPVTRTLWDILGVMKPTTRCHVARAQHLVCTRTVCHDEHEFLGRQSEHSIYEAQTHLGTSLGRSVMCHVILQNPYDLLVSRQIF